jgi:hypothetical protein
VILVLGVLLMYYGEFHRVSSNEGSRAPLAWLAEPLAALQTIDKLVGVYFRGNTLPQFMISYVNEF